MLSLCEHMNATRIRCEDSTALAFGHHCGEMPHYSSRYSPSGINIGPRLLTRYTLACPSQRLSRRSVRYWWNCNPGRYSERRQVYSRNDRFIFKVCACLCFARQNYINCPNGFVKFLDPSFRCTSQNSNRSRIEFSTLDFLELFLAVESFKRRTIEYQPAANLHGNNLNKLSNLDQGSF